MKTEQSLFTNKSDLLDMLPTQKPESKREHGFGVDERLGSLTQESSKFAQELSHKSKASAPQPSRPKAAAEEAQNTRAPQTEKRAPDKPARVKSAAKRAEESQEVRSDRRAAREDEAPRIDSSRAHAAHSARLASEEATEEAPEALASATSGAEESEESEEKTPLGDNGYAGLQSFDLTPLQQQLGQLLFDAQASKMNDIKLSSLPNEHSVTFTAIDEDESTVPGFLEGYLNGGRAKAQSPGWQAQGAASPTLGAKPLADAPQPALNGAQESADSALSETSPLANPAQAFNALGTQLARQPLAQLEPEPSASKALTEQATRSQLQKSDFEPVTPRQTAPVVPTPEARSSVPAPSKLAAPSAAITPQLLSDVAAPEVAAPQGAVSAEIAQLARFLQALERDDDNRPASAEDLSDTVRTTRAALQTEQAALGVPAGLHAASPLSARPGEDKSEQSFTQNSQQQQTGDSHKSAEAGSEKRAVDEAPSLSAQSAEGAGNLHRYARRDALTSHYQSQNSQLPAASAAPTPASQSSQAAQTSESAEAGQQGGAELVMMGGNGLFSLAHNAAPGGALSDAKGVSAPWYTQIVQSAQMLDAAQGGKASLSLSVPGMGEVAVSIVASGNDVHIECEVKNQNAQHNLQIGLTDLRQAFANAGLSLSNFVVKSSGVQSGLDAKEERLKFDKAQKSLRNSREAAGPGKKISDEEGDEAEEEAALSQPGVNIEL